MVITYNLRGFLYYHPHLTFSDRKSDCFIDPKGKSQGDLDVDTDALFCLGRKVYGLLDPECDVSRDEFDQGHIGYLNMIDEWRVSVVEMYAAKRLKFIDHAGLPVTKDVNVDEMDDSQIISIIWQQSSTLGAKKLLGEDQEALRVIEQTLLFHALKEIDHALIGLRLDGGTVVATIEAANALSNAIAIRSGNEQLTMARRQFAYQGAIEKIKRDPKQKEKLFVRECWQDWQKKPDSYKSKAAFAKDMLTKCEHLESQKKIEDWCREWEVKNGTQQAE
ncbi:MAG: hypothetical protein WC073_09030 [Sterolibacterium sp.]